MRLRLLMLGMLAACAPRGERIGAHCEELGQRCRLEGNVLGVCAEDLSPSCPRPPCLRCQDQH
ncbi:MAG: hypothetical protein AAF447_14255 [Myxococcota bacterium]